MTRLLYLIFVLSGAAGLIYESIWSRYLGLFVGHSAYAQIIVLTIFLGGMSIGALAIERRTERIRNPLVVYAGVELAIGLIALGFHWIFLAVTGAAYDTIFPHLAPTGALIVIAKWGIAGALILPQSVLLGATFPLMSAGVLRLVRERPGHVLSLLYFANSLGAAVGVLIAGFYLLATSGLEGTLTTAAMINVVAFLGAYLAGRRMQMPASPDDPDGMARTDALGAAVPAETRPVAAARPAAAAGTRLLLGVAFGTAVASFVYEIAWIRMLSLVLGSATHSFELMLSAFILGLALGALWARSRADRFADPVCALGVVQWAMGLAALATLPVYLASFHWTASLIAALTPTGGGYRLFTIARYAFCLAVMLPATFFAGITLPLITRTLIARGQGERAIGAVYAVNTLGSIVGVILAGLVLMPLVGLKALLIEGAIIDSALGVLLLRTSAHPRRRQLAWGAATVLLAGVLASFAFNHFDRALLSSGVYRYGSLPAKNDRRILFYADGRTATVTVGQSTFNKSMFIATNGKPDASMDTNWLHVDPRSPPRYLGGDISTQVLVPLISLAHVPHARTAAVIGQGSGMTSHFLLGSPELRQVVTIEIEPEMVRGSRLFYPANRRVFDDPRSRIVIDDAKSFFATDGRRYDLIVSEPSNPWVSGVSSLFTDEFYARVRRYLEPHGVFGQWLHLYEIDDGLVLSVLAAVHRNFQSYAAFMTSNADLVIVASLDTTLPSPDWSLFQWPTVAGEMRRVIPFTPATLEGARLIDRQALAPLMRLVPIANSDFNPVLDLGAERTRFLHANADGFNGLRAGRFDLIDTYFGHRMPFDTTPLTTVPSIPRLGRLAVAAALRREIAPTRADSLSGTDVLAAFHRRWQFERELADDASPVEWRNWLADALEVERDLHGGTAGVADEAFYTRLRHYAERHRAPAGVERAIAFTHGLAAWNFAEASQAADSLLSDAVVDASWIPVDELREGGMIAKLRLGDVDGARRLWFALAKRSARPAGDLRVLLLQAYLLEADERAHPERARGAVSP